MHILTLPRSALFRALGDPTRLRIMVLLEERELCVCDLIAVLGLPQSTVSRHMGILRGNGLVTERREGRWVHYKLFDPLPLIHLRPCLVELSAAQPHRDDLVHLREQQAAKECRQ